MQGPNAAVPAGRLRARANKVRWWCAHQALKQVLAQVHSGTRNNGQGAERGGGEAPERKGRRGGEERSSHSPWPLPVPMYSVPHSVPRARRKQKQTTDYAAETGRLGPWVLPQLHQMKERNTARGTAQRGPQSETNQISQSQRWTTPPGPGAETAIQAHGPD